MNWYTYGWSRPTVSVDPSGKISWIAVSGIVIVVWIIGCGGLGILAVELEGIFSLSGQPNADKLAHCVAACVIRRCGSIVMSWMYGHLKEVLDWATGDGYNPNDLCANNRGEWCAKQVGSVTQCGGCCSHIYPVPGHQPYMPWFPPSGLHCPPPKCH